jgi:hypothetical protein
MALIDIKESELNQWLFGENPCRDFLWTELSLATAHRPFFCVPTRRLGSGLVYPGDIDVLISSPNAEFVTVIETKRIKIKPETFGTGSPNKTGDLKLGVEQTNALCRFGFSRSFLGIVLVTDSSKRSTANLLCRSATGQLVKLVEENPSFAGLDKRAGLVVFEITQPSEKDFRMCAGFRCSVVKPASVKTQSAELTASIRVILKDL